MHHDFRPPEGQASSWDIKHFHSRLKQVVLRRLHLAASADITRTEQAGNKVRAYCSDASRTSPRLYIESPHMAWLDMSLCANAGPVQKNPQRITATHQNIEPKIKFVAIQQQRLADIPSKLSCSAPLTGSAPIKNFRGD